MKTFNSRNHKLRPSAFRETTIGLPKVSKIREIDVITFQNEWQIKFLWSEEGLEFFHNYLEGTGFPYRAVLRFHSINHLTDIELRNLVDIFLPLIENEGVVAICELQESVEKMFSRQLLHCLFEIRSDLESALDFIIEVTG